MQHFVTVRATLKRGALVTAANWPVVAIQFIADSTFKLLLGVPVVGGAVLVALALGRDLRDVLSGDLREIVTTVSGTLFTHPAAFVGFLCALLVMLAGGSVLLFLVKGGTVAVLAAGEGLAGPVERAPLHTAGFGRAAQYSIDAFLSGSGRLFKRYVRLGLILFAAYAVSGTAYLIVVFGSYSLVGGTVAALGWTVVAAVCSSALFVWITIVNLGYLLLQMIVAVEDCNVRTAVRVLGRFLRAQGRDVAIVFLVVLGLVVVATAASLLATTGLGLISFVPLIGLAVFPLQAAAWLVRGLVFQYLGLTALGAYLALYRSSAVGAAAANGPALVRTA